MDSGLGKLSIFQAAVKKYWKGGGTKAIEKANLPFIFAISISIKHFIL